MDFKAIHVQEKEFSHLLFAWIRKYFERISHSLFGQQVKKSYHNFLKKRRKIKIHETPFEGMREAFIRGRGPKISPSQRKISYIK